METENKHTYQNYIIQIEELLDHKKEIDDEIKEIKNKMKKIKNINPNILDYVRDKEDKGQDFFVFYNLDAKTRIYLEARGYKKLKTRCSIYTKVDLYFDKPGEIELEFDFRKDYKKYNNKITNYSIEYNILNNRGFDEDFLYNEPIEPHNLLERYCDEDEDEFVAENNYLVLDIDNCGFEKLYYLDFIMMIKSPTRITQDNELVNYINTTDNELYVIENNTINDNEEIRQLLTKRNYQEFELILKISKDMYDDYSIKKICRGKNLELKRTSGTYKTVIDIIKNNKGFTEKYNINSTISEEDLFEVFSTIDKTDKSIWLVGIVKMTAFIKI